MLVQSLFPLAFVLPTIYACPGHDNHALTPNRKRAVGNSDWGYEASFNWGKLNPKYALCQTGTQQSPIPLSLSNGLSLNHIPVFNYPAKVSGNFFNWGYGPAFTLTPESDWTSKPSFTYDNKINYLKGWHIHAPAEHAVDGDRTKAEMHFVHGDASGKETAVLGFRIDPGSSNSTFFNQFPSYISFNDTEVKKPREIDLRPALEGVLSFNEFWTYEGSFTTPPCTQGIRWFVARQVLFTGVDQMRAILGASTYSARVQQEVWQHRINE